MTYTINYTVENSTCTGTPTIYLEDDLITDYIAALPSPDHTLKLTITVNCDTSYEIDVDDDNVNLNTVDGRYEITPDDVGLTTSIDDSIYYIELTKTVTATGSTVSSYSCIFVDCELKCKLFDYLATHLESDIVKFYERLTDLNTCGDCECQAACVFYCKLQEALTGEEIPEGCGCK